jgi:hypothetical protein
MSQAESLANPVLLVPARNAAIQGAKKLGELIQPNGKFLYAYEYPDGKPLKQYNILRHYGSLWSITLTMLSFPDEIPTENWSKVLNSLYWGQSHAKLQHNLPPDDATNIWEFIVWHDQIKLGANALALLALSQFIQQIIDSSYRTDMVWGLDQLYSWVKHAEQLACGIHKLRREDGSFIHKTIFTTMQPTDFVSDYYLGEALFALAHWRITCKSLNSHTSSWDKPIAAVNFGSYQAYPLIEQSLQQLSSQNYGVEFQSHWMLYMVSHEICYGDFPDTLVPYMDALVDDILQRPYYRRRKQANPIACRTEGLLIALKAYRDFGIWGERQEKMLQAIDVNIMLILQWAKEDGAIIHGNKSNEVRIDSIQHGITALLNYTKLDSLGNLA